MSWKDAQADREKQKRERTSALKTMFNTGSLPEDAPDDDDEMQDRTGLIKQHGKGGKNAWDEDDEEENPDYAAINKAGRDDDDNDEEEPAAPPTKKAPVQKDDDDEEFSHEQQNRELRQRNAELAAMAEQANSRFAKLESDLESVKRGNTAAQIPADYKEDPELPWVEKPQLARLQQEIEANKESTHQLLMSQERNSFNQSVTRMRERHERFGQHFPDDVVETVWKQFAANPKAFASPQSPHGFGQAWEAGFEQEFKKRDYDNLTKAQAAQAKKADEVTKKREQKSAEQTKNLAKVPRSGQSYQETSSKAPLPRARREMKTLRGDMMRHMAQGG